MNFIDTGTISSIRGAKQHLLRRVSWLIAIQCSLHSSSVFVYYFPPYLTASAVMGEMMLARSELESRIGFMKEICHFCFLVISASRQFKVYSLEQ